MFVPKAVFPIEGLPAIIIKSELWSPPSFLSKSLRPVGMPAILPSFLNDLSIMFIALFKASLNNEYFLSALPVWERLYKSFSAFSIKSTPLKSSLLETVFCTIPLPIPKSDLLICKSYNNLAYW